MHRQNRVSLLLLMITLLLANGVALYYLMG